MEFLKEEELQVEAQVQHDGMVKMLQRLKGEIGDLHNRLKEADAKTMEEERNAKALDLRLKRQEKLGVMENMSHGDAASELESQLVMSEETRARLSVENEALIKMNKRLTESNGAMETEIISIHEAMTNAANSKILKSSVTNDDSPTREIAAEKRISELKELNDGVDEKRKLLEVSLTKSREDLTLAQSSLKRYQEELNKSKEDLKSRDVDLARAWSQLAEHGLDAPGGTSDDASIQENLTLLSETRLYQAHLEQTVAAEQSYAEAQVLRAKLYLEEVDQARRCEEMIRMDGLLEEAMTSIGGIWSSLGEMNSRLPYVDQVACRYPKVPLGLEKELVYKDLQEHKGKEGERPVKMERRVESTVEHLRKLFSFTETLSRRVNSRDTEIVNENTFIREVLEQAKRGETGSLVNRLWSEHEGTLRELTNAHARQLKSVEDTCMAQVQRLQGIHDTEIATSRSEVALCKKESEKHKARLLEIEAKTLTELGGLRTSLNALSAENKELLEHGGVNRVELEASLHKIERLRQENGLLATENTGLKVERHRLWVGEMVDPPPPCLRAPLLVRPPNQQLPTLQFIKNTEDQVRSSAAEGAAKVALLLGIDSRKTSVYRDPNSMRRDRSVSRSVSEAMEDYLK